LSVPISDAQSSYRETMQHGCDNITEHRSYVSVRMGDLITLVSIPPQDIE
jgi:hypothetical protein